MLDWDKLLIKQLSKCPPDGSGNFTRAQVDELQSMLGLDSYETADMVARLLSGYLDGCERYAEARKIVPSDKEAKERLLKIARHAKELARLLRQDPYGDRVIPRPKRRREGGRMTLGEIREATLRPKEFLEALRRLEERATRQATNPSEFARVRHLPPNGNTTNSKVQIATRELWPKLFELWVECGKRLSSTEDGPTHRFLKLVHKVADLPEPKRSTLRDAVEDWNMANAEPNKPPVRHGGE